MHIFKKDGYATGSLLTWKKVSNRLLTTIGNWLKSSCNSEQPIRLCKSVLAEEEFLVLPSWHKSTSEACNQLINKGKSAIPLIYFWSANFQPTKPNHWCLFLSDSHTHWVSADQTQPLTSSRSNPNATMLQPSLSPLLLHLLSLFQFPLPHVDLVSGPVTSSKSVPIKYSSLRLQSSVSAINDPKSFLEKHWPVCRWEQRQKILSVAI